MVDRSGRMATTNTKARPEKPWASCISNMASTVAACHSILTEADIPGAWLCGRKPLELKNEELKFWLQCKDAPVKDLKTKVELARRWEIGLSTFCFLSISWRSDIVYKCDVKLIFTFFRVNNYIKSGRDKNTVDTDPNRLFTRHVDLHFSCLFASSVNTYLIIFYHAGCLLLCNCIPWIKWNLSWTQAKPFTLQKATNPRCV